MKVKIKAHELREADVTHISLVERGANQIPFRIIKSADKEKGSMINLDLAKLFKGEKADAPKAPAVVGYVILKEDNTDEVKKVLKEAGVEIGFEEVCEDGCVIFKQAKDVSIEEVTPIKLSPDLVALTKGFDPITEGGALKEVVEAQGFFPGVGMAMDALHSTLRTSLQKSESAQDAESAVSGLLDEFKSYVVSLSKSLPVEAFKASEALSILKASDGYGKKKPMHNEEEMDEMHEGEDDKMKDKAKKADDKAGDDKQEETKKEETKKEEDTRIEAVLKSVETLSGAVTKLQQSLEKVSGDVATIAKTQEETKKELDASVKKSEALEKALKGTVIGANPEDDEADPKKTQKAEYDGGALLDTAYQRNVRTRKSFNYGRKQ